MKRKFISLTTFCISLISVCFVIFFTFKVTERNSLIDELIKGSISNKFALNNEEVAIAISREIYRRTNSSLDLGELELYDKFESISLFNVTSSVGLKYSGYGIKGHSTYGPCGTMSRTLLNALWSLNIQARKLQLLDNKDGYGGGHTMVEFFHQGKWVIISPADSSFTWRRNNGMIATLEEIKADSAIFASIYNYSPRYSYLFDNTKNIRWEKLRPSIRNIFRILLGVERYENATTPQLYDKPRTLFLYLSMISALFFGVITLFFRFSNDIKQ